MLASLSQADFELIRPHLRSIDLKSQTVLARTGEAVTHVHFPHVGIISLVTRLLEGDSVEAAMVGRDTLFGAAAALDGGPSLNEAVVQATGTASILETAQLRRAAEQSATLRLTLFRHERAMTAQAMQSAACNVSHSVEARMSRWLLRARDLAGDNLALTQEFLSQMLGVQRSSVSLVANTLQKAGLISFRRGHIRIVDVPGLLESSCECYAAVKAHYDRLHPEA
jgi:CRP-like cAMP-binding protein